MSDSAEAEATRVYDHAGEAASLLYWHHTASNTWRRHDREKGGWHVGSPQASAEQQLAFEAGDDWRPWSKVLDATHAPYYQWFVGARTNASFNLVDKHLLEGRGQEVAYTCCEEDGTEFSMTRRELAVEVACAASRLRKEMSLAPRSRVLLHLPTGCDQMVWLLACMRVGATYTATAVDHPLSALRYRLSDFQPDVIITTDTPSQAAGATVVCGDKIAALEASGDLGGAGVLKIGAKPQKVPAKAAAAGVEGGSPARAKRPPIPRAAAGARATVGSTAVKDDPKLSDAQLLAKLSKASPAEPVCADFPLFVSYTSGSTGNPKGIVHCHGGYVYGVALTMRVVFRIDRAADRMLTLATTGWITGQSYMLVGPLVSGCHCVMLAGSPVYPKMSRFAETIEKHGVTIFKTGSALVRQLMVDPAAHAALDEADLSSLRQATFCAEPVSREVHEYACRVITPNFMNSYWATEHGGIVWTRGLDKPIQPDTRAYPLPWIVGAIDEEGEAEGAREGNGNGEHLPYGNVLVMQPYPYLARTIFGDIEHARDENWRGDVAKLKATYFEKGSFMQGDNARLHPDGGYTFHGRSDEVINVNGNRVGTEEIERIVWAVGGDKVKSCAVVGGPDFSKGTTPVPFVVLDDGELTKPVAQERADLLSAVSVAAKAQLGSYAVPDDMLFATAIPFTQTGKVARKALQCLLADTMPDPGALKNPATLGALREGVIGQWRLYQANLSRTLDASKPWEQYHWSEHTLQHKPLVPGAGWMTVLTELYGVSHLSDVMFVKALHEPTTGLHVLKRRRRVTISDAGAQLVQASLGEKTGTSLPAAGDVDVPARPPSSLWTEFDDDQDSSTHYRYCDRIKMNYLGTYRIVERVQWRGYEFCARAGPGHLSAVLDAPLQIICGFHRLETFIPTAVTSFDILRRPQGSCTSSPTLVAGEIVSLRTNELSANIAFYTSDDDAPWAVMRGVTFTKVFKAPAPRLQPNEDAVAESVSAPARGRRYAMTQMSEGERTTMVLKTIKEIGHELTSSEVDENKTLFENGLHSLRSVELISKLNRTFSTNLSTKMLTEARDVAELAANVAKQVLATSATAVTADATRSSRAPSARDIFANVDQDSLDEIVDKQINRPFFQLPKNFDRAPAMIWYIIKRGMFATLKKQWDEGVYRHFFNPAKKIDLSKECIVDYQTVTDSQCDFNDHFTVREIVPASEEGYYNLLVETGLQHFEYFFGRTFFCSNLTCNFYKEIPMGKKYMQKAKIIDVKGPIFVASVAFHDEVGDLCFTVDWSLIMPVGKASDRQVYDFEVGLSGVDQDAKFDGSSQKTPATTVPAEMLEGTTVETKKHV